MWFRPSINWISGLRLQFRRDVLLGGFLFLSHPQFFWYHLLSFSVFRIFGCFCQFVPCLLWWSLGRLVVISEKQGPESQCKRFARRSAAWSWNPFRCKSGGTCTQIGKNRILTTNSACARLTNSALSDTTKNNINMYACTQIWVWKTQNQMGREEPWLDEWLVTNLYDSGCALDSKTLSQRHCVVVDHLNKFKIYFQNGSRGPIKNVVLMRNMGFISY